MPLLQRASAAEITDAVDLLLSHADAVPAALAEALVRSLSRPSHPSAIDYGPEFDLLEEVGYQIQTVHAMREAVLTEGNRLQPGMTTRDLNELNRASASLLTGLAKYHEKIINMERLRAVEEAVLSMMNLWPEE